MEEKEDQSLEISPSSPGPGPSTDFKANAESEPSARDFGGFEGPDDVTVAKVGPESEKEREVDLNLLFPGKGYDLNRLFPDKGTKKLLLELRRNKRDIQRFIKNLDFEEEY